MILKRIRAQATITNRGRLGERGFTLIEALIATLVLSFGLIAISNLMIVSTSANYLANQSTAATMLAAQQMELLRSVNFTALTVSPGDTLETPTVGWSVITDVPGVGNFLTTWRIQNAMSNTVYIQVRSESTRFLGRRTRAEFTSYRACTLTGSGCAAIN